MSTRLFGRLVVVQLGSTGSTGREYTDLRISFAVDMSDSSEPNQARIEIYNANPEAIAAMQTDDAVVRLLVGYESDGGVPRLLFEGNPVKNGVHTRHRDVDRILTIEAQDGGREYTTGHVAVSYSTGTTSGQMFAALAEELGVALGNVDAVVRDVSFPHGLVLVGRAADQLDRVAAMSNARWQIRDGTLQVWEDGSSTGEAAVVFSVAAGNLVGSPTPTDIGVEVTGLLAPTLRPGKPFRVESASVEGDYVATSVRFHGDSGFRNDFYVVAEGTPLA